MENQIELERETSVPQSSLSRIIKEFKETGRGNPTIKNLAPMIDYYGFKLVDPRQHKSVSESDVRDKIANEVMKGLLQSGHGDVASIVFALITKTEMIQTAVAQSSDCEPRAAGGF